ncbi:hypothetical protein [Streptomyces sp. NPDC058548]|uniref:hypothetical protein n=1 Tax=Streptomyces sp. NPDC058548 TaxID=3346545 RepID=UPI003662581E
MKAQIHTAINRDATPVAPLALAAVAKDVWRDVQVTGVHVIDANVEGRVRIHGLTVRDAPNGARTVFAKSEWGAVVKLWFSHLGDVYPEWVAKCIDATN